MKRLLILPSLLLLAGCGMCEDHYHHRRIQYLVEHPEVGASIKAMIMDGQRIRIQSNTNVDDYLDALIIIDRVKPRPQ